MSAAEERPHVLVIANETVAGQALIDRLTERAAPGAMFVTVLAPVSIPREGYVVYQDTRRASAGRRLDRTLAALREAGVSAHGMVVEADPVDALRDALAQLDPPVTDIVVSTHPRAQSGWLRRNVVEKMRKAAGAIPVEHVVVNLQAEHGPANVLVVANETLLGPPLQERIRSRAQRSPASFLLVAPQSDPSGTPHPDAERRLRRAVAQLRSEGVDVHGQVAHPDPYTAILHAVRDERVDEIIISTYPNERSGWLRRDLVGRVRRETGLPVDHVVVAPSELEAVRA